MKIATIVGARPQFIKAAGVSRCISNYTTIEEILIHTGQHFDKNMSDVFFDELDIPKPTYNLSIGGGTHGQNTGRSIESIEEILLKETPDFVLVYGDTDSTLAGALAASKLHIPIAHVESGLRSYNRRMPEEINRVLTDHISDVLFAPTETAVENLFNEGIHGTKVHNVGDVMYDAAMYYGVKAQKYSKILETISLVSKQYILATIHRQENTDDPIRLQSIFSGFANAKYPIILPLHPRTRKQISKGKIEIPQIVTIVDPLGYLDMVMLEKNARLIATDSGGVQKEAYFHQVPCITLREETEWVELVRLGINKLVGANSLAIKASLEDFNPPTFSSNNLYGDGNSSQHIVEYFISLTR